MIDYLAAALEQDKPEEQEPQVNLNLREPLSGQIAEGNNSITPAKNGSIAPAASNKVLPELPFEMLKNGTFRVAETCGQRKSAESGTASVTRGRNEMVEEAEKFFKGRLEAAGQAQLAGAFYGRRLMPLEAIRLRAKTGFDAIARPGKPEQSVPLATALRRTRAGIDFVQRERRNLSVVLPEAPVIAGTLSAEELDRAVERDARRYDGGFSMY